MPEIPSSIDVSRHIEPARALVTEIESGTPGLHVVHARDWALYEEGHVDLVQCRVSSGSRAKFEYMAIKRSDGRKLSAANSAMN